MALAMLLPDALPGRAEEPKQTKKDKDKGKQRRDQIDSTVEAWVQELAKHFNDKNPIIRQSARAGLVGAGQAALPALRKIAEGNDDAADIARMMVSHVERRRHESFGSLLGRQLLRRTWVPPAEKPKGRTAEAKKPEKPAEAKKPQAESQKPPLPRARVLRGRLLRDLQLDDKQRAKVAEIVAANQKKVRELAQKVRRRDIDRDKLRGEIDKLQEGLRKDLKEVLTEEQFKKVEEATKGLRPREPSKPAKPAKPTKPQKDAGE
jgi:hypothetical protein